MPSKSPKQKRFMAAAAHDPGFARKAGISQSVAQEFNQADARKPKARKKSKGKKKRDNGDSRMAKMYGGLSKDSDY